MNRAWKHSAMCLAAALVLLTGTSKPQGPSSASPPAPKKFTDAAGNRGAATGNKATHKPHNKGNAADSAVHASVSGNPIPTPTPPHDPASQPVTQAQIKQMITQTQHTKDLDSLKQNLEEKIAEVSPPQDLNPLKHQVERSKLFGVFGILAGGTALIVLIILFFLQARSFDREIELLKQTVERQYNELNKNVSELKRRNTDFVSGERFEGLEKLVSRLEEGLKASRPARTWAGDNSPPQPWPEPQVQQEPVRDFTAVAAAKARVTIYYADLPDRDGCFKDTSIKDNPDWDSLYRLTPDSDGGCAAVEIYNDSQRFEAAMKATQDYLSPVCEYQSNPPPGAKKIKQVRSGRVERDGQGWRIKQKLQIEFV